MAGRLDPGDGADGGGEPVALAAQPGDRLGPLLAGQVVGRREADGCATFSVPARR